MNINPNPDLFAILKDACLVGANLDRMVLRNRNLSGINFTDCSLRGTDLSGSNLKGCKFVKADLSQAVFHLADFTDCDFSAADLSMSCGRGTLFNGANLSYAHVRQVFYKHCFFVGANLQYADFARGFFLGSCFNDATGTNKIRNLDSAVFRWWRPLKEGPISYVPKEGYVEVNYSDTGTLSLQENAGHRRVDL